MTDHAVDIYASGHGCAVAIIMPLATVRGGCEVMLLNFLRANRAAGRAQYCVCFLSNGPMVEIVRKIGYPVHVIEAGRLRHGHSYVRTIIKIAHWCREQQLSHVMSWMEKAHLYGGPAAWLAGVSSSWWLHSINPDSRMMRLVTMIPTSHIFCTSQSAATVQQRRWPRFPRSVCYAAADVHQFAAHQLPAPVDARRQLGLPLDRPIVGTVARLQRWKGINVFIDAAAKVLASGKLAHFVIVGGEHDLEPGVKQELETQIQTLGISDHVRMVGFQSDVPLWMQAFDTFVHSSTGVEPFGIVIVEAMSLGKLTIASAAGGPTEIITDGVNGRLSPPGDAATLGKLILDTLLDLPENDAMRENARRRAQDFGSDRLAREVSETIASVLGREVEVESAG